MAELTPWFDGKTLPVREGFYDVRTAAGKELRALYGKAGWSVPAQKEGDAPTPLADVREWRGLTAPAE